ncbi:hypothetical protein OsI_38117 [Oryza sativa Indica Group]|uniref:Uncharacterized protein n=1 Tax=Oryza sativa subsp. indica TaxID=39946 RepID=A2ZJX0_ORYSI|nr:hypothetical protein OsI_38117 [Oryza sativa Indica Group]
MPSLAWSLFFSENYDKFNHKLKFLLGYEPIVGLEFCNPLFVSQSSRNRLQSPPPTVKEKKSDGDASILKTRLTNYLTILHALQERGALLVLGRQLAERAIRVQTV